MNKPKNEVLSERDVYEFMPAAIEIEKTPASPVGRVILYSIMLLFLVAVLWTYFGKIDIVAVAKGKVVPTESVKVIQPLETAVIESIHVGEGERVVKGQPLVTLDADIPEADVRNFREQWRGVALKRLRLAELVRWFESAEGWSASLQTENQDLQAFVPAQRALLNQEVNELDAIVRNIDQETDRLVAEQKMVAAEVKKNQRLLEVLDERVAAYDVLQQRGIGSRMDFLKVKQEQIEIEQNVSVQRARINQLAASIAANESKREMVVAERFKNTLSELEGLTVQEATLREELLKAKLRSRQYVLKAPVDGTVQELVVTTVGGVVTPAQELMKLVPEGGGVEVEAKFLNKDIGFIHSGQSTEIKVDTFNFTKYGVIDAELVDISNDAVKDEQLGLVYYAKIKPDRSSLSINGKNIKLSPGMTVIAEVKTGERRIIEFFLSPLLRYQEESLSER